MVARLGAGPRRRAVLLRTLDTISWLVEGRLRHQRTRTRSLGRIEACVSPLICVCVCVRVFVVCARRKPTAKKANVCQRTPRAGLLSPPPRVPQIRKNLHVQVCIEKQTLGEGPTLEETLNFRKSLEGVCFYVVARGKKLARASLHRKANTWREFNFRGNSQL